MMSVFPLSHVDDDRVEAAGNDRRETMLQSRVPEDAAWPDGMAFPFPCAMQMLIIKAARRGILKSWAFRQPGRWEKACSVSPQRSDL